MHRLDLTGKPLSLNRGDIRDTMQTIRTSFSTSCGQVAVCTVQSGKHRSDKLPRSYIIEFLLKIETVTVICTATAHRHNFLYHDAWLFQNKQKYVDRRILQVNLRKTSLKQINDS